MSCATIAEETVFIRISIEIDRFYFIDAGSDQAMDDVGFEIEMRFSGNAIQKEPRVVRIGMHETRFELTVHFIGRLSDARTDRRMDIFAPGTELFHRFDCRIRDPGKSTAPSGVSCTDNHCLVISKQHRRTIGG